MSLTIVSGPQPEVIEMLNSLHASFKDFTPVIASFESFREEHIKNLPAKELKDYSFDLVD